MKRFTNRFDLFHIFIWEKAHKNTCKVRNWEGDLIKLLSVIFKADKLNDGCEGRQLTRISVLLLHCYTAMFN